MSQTRAYSALEALTNLIVGFGLAVLVQLGLFPAVGIRMTLVQSLQTGLAFTLVSVLRSYTVRPLFNRIEGRRRLL